MAEIDNATLIVALQAVFESANRYEAILDSETLSDPENVTEILMNYDEALRVLKAVYKIELDSGADLPPLESIIVSKKC